mmetsp:Transcript_45288/g.137287  ORF Transcript_45288/g.137287 Transcript_45288/m.137287 type:complete len:569 (+) Transcript_45288:268-1974(+)
MTLGLVASAGSRGVPIPTRACWSFPNLTRKLLHLRRTCLGEHAAQVNVTTIHLTKNMKSRPHVDRGNLGWSDLVAVGDFTGGGTWVELTPPQSAGLHIHTHIMEESIPRGKYWAGDHVRGHVVDVHNRWLHFDANKLHFTMDFAGERYCIIFFGMKRQAQTPSVARVYMERLGFGFAHVLGAAAPSAGDMAIVEAALRGERIVGSSAPAPPATKALARRGTKRPAATVPRCLRPPPPLELERLVGNWRLSGGTFDLQRQGTGLVFTDSRHEGKILEGALQREQKNVWAADLAIKTAMSSLGAAAMQACGVVELEFFPDRDELQVQETVFLSWAEEHIAGVARRVLPTPAATSNDSTSVRLVIAPPEQPPMPTRLLPHLLVRSPSAAGHASSSLTILPERGWRSQLHVQEMEHATLHQNKAATPGATAAVKGDALNGADSCPLTETSAATLPVVNDNLSALAVPVKSQPSDHIRVEPESSPWAPLDSVCVERAMPEVPADVMPNATQETTVAAFVSMGFSMQEADEALRSARGDAELAVAILCSQANTSSCAMLANNVRAEASLSDCGC